MIEKIHTRLTIWYIIISSRFLPKKVELNLSIYKKTTDPIIFTCILKDEEL